MKGIILVGGLGTRLRPLTLTEPKPLIPFMNKPIIMHQIEALAAAGVTEIILAVGYMPETLKQRLDAYTCELPVKITYSIEETSMGTAGPLSLIRDILENETEPFFVLNSDVICEYPFKEMIAYHQLHQRAGTIAATKVNDPSRYGVMIYDEDNTLQRFVEKPTTFVGDRINAGIYLLTKRVLDYVQNTPMSMENDVLPKMARNQEIKVFSLPGFWMDIGQPKDYILGHQLYFQSTSTNRKSVFIDSTARISPSATIGPNTVIGPNVIVEDGAEIEDSVVLEGARIKENSLVASSIIGWRAQIGRWSRIEDCSVIGANVKVQDGIYISEGRILPDTQVSLHVLIPSKTQTPIQTPTTP
ncbi:mannose-1-phosphate guanylyltransferase [Nematocida homosporus]|uniref:mannose-1-phosphate guanylyltransferase n=1 Tax=Nematocida homosporus TaxID=1912981 RepID=UPI00221F8F00|nr:mannose-1-phosphate guanylyltransferase [Nematocida homosporus]KAI5186754.1 mannose-1-phosphate guanylyltransferase [Nematocida homosporus]